MIARSRAGPLALYRFLDQSVLGDISLASSVTRQWLGTADAIECRETARDNVG